MVASVACAPVTDDEAPPRRAEFSPPSVTYQRDGTVWVRPAGHGNVVDIGAGVDGKPQHPDWSPDGSRLAFETDFATIWTVAADGSDTRRLYDCSGRCVAVQDAAWSPDGSEIAFVEARTTDGVHTSQGMVRVVDVASGAVRTIHRDRTGRVWVFQPRWSDGGGELVYEEDVFASSKLAESVVTRVRVVTIESDGRSRHVVGAWKPSRGPGSPDPDWSGDSLVLVRHDNLVLVDTATGERRRLTTYDGDTRHAIQPTFGPDGRSIAFTYVRGGFGVDDVAEGAVVDARTGEVTMLGLPGATHVRLGPS